MYPVLFEYYGFKITSYGFMLMSAFLISNYLLKKYLKSININPKIGDDLIFYAAIGGILGSKIYYIIEFWPTGEGYNNLIGFVNVFKGLFTLNISLFTQGINQFGSGLVFLGGLIGGLVTVSYYINKNKLNWFTVTDWLAPYLILGQSIGRIGCFLVGDCYGKPTDLPWAVSFGNGLPPTTYESFKYNYPEIFDKYILSIYNINDIIRVHPTQLYETITYFFAFIYLYKVRNYKNYDGEIFLEYLFIAGILRFLIEFYRLNPTYYFNLSGAQFICLAMISISSFLMFKKRINMKII